MGLIIKNNVVYNGAESEPIIYSEEEREVGVWTDGRPLYQKTYYDSYINPGSGAHSTNHDLPGIITQVIPGYIRYEYQGGVYYLIGSQMNSYLQITIPADTPSPTYFIATQTVGGVTQTDIYYTVQYIKETDTPGSGTWTPSGVKTVHYSENEQVVGTWVDGSTIYERTYVLTNSINVNNYNWTSTSIPINDMNKIINCWGMHESGTYWGDLCAALNINTYINLKCSRNGDTIDLKTFTIQYTKTTS